MQTNNPSPTWQVLLIGGASGVGKTNVSYRLAQHYGIGITEVDDFQVILERMTSVEQYPTLHFWRDHPEAAQRMDEEQHLQFFISYARVMAIALELVIANHIESRAPIVLEGDFILPELATLSAYDGISAAGQVCGLFIYEPDEGQIARNYLAREGEEQPQRARASWRNSEWLRQEAERLGVPAIPARPWDTVFERAIAAIGLFGRVTPGRDKSAPLHFTWEPTTWIAWVRHKFWGDVLICRGEPLFALVQSQELVTHPDCFTYLATQTVYDKIHNHRWIL